MTRISQTFAALRRPDPERYGGLNAPPCRSWGGRD